MKKSFFNISGTILCFIFVGLRLAGLIVNSENISDIFSNYLFYIYVALILGAILAVKEMFFEGENDQEE
tara:strand:- start:186 stop:392 length:207 start_codon:yes stop_codon:yes gene_type:complete